jgi:hypothetical protein
VDADQENMRSVVLAFGLSLFALSFATTACSAPADDKQEEDKDVRDARKRKSLDPDGVPAEGEGAPLKPSQPGGGGGAPPSQPAPAEGQAPAAKNTCETARSVGTISGDTNADKVTTEGTCSEWLKVRVTENQESFVAYPQKILVTLVPPKGVDLDVEVYVNLTSDLNECAAVRGSGRTAGDKTEAVPLTWGEEAAANGAEDGRTVNILVKAKGACNDQSWSLIVEGNR